MAKYERDTSEKYRERIKKLLEMSMSDNEHEAKMAANKAIKLMEEHNITSDEVYKQNMCSEIQEFKFTRLTTWQKELFVRISHLSGCIFTYRNGVKDVVQAHIRFTGRERDVENALYLSVILINTVVKMALDYKMHIRALKSRNEGKTNTRVNSYRIGLIDRIYERLQDVKTSFFNDHQAQNKNLPVLSTDTRLLEAEQWLLEQSGIGIKKKKPQKPKSITVVEEDLNAGIRDGDSVDLQQAVKGKKTYKVGN